MFQTGRMIKWQQQFVLEVRLEVVEWEEGLALVEEKGLLEFLLKGNSIMRSFLKGEGKGEGNAWIRSKSGWL